MSCSFSAEDVSVDALLAEVVELQSVESEGGHQAAQLGVFEKMYDDTPNFQLQIKEQGREKYDARQKMTTSSDDMNDGKGGVSVAAVGSLQESGFAALRAISRLKEMQTSQYQSSGGIHRPARRTAGGGGQPESQATA